MLSEQLDQRMGTGTNTKGNTTVRLFDLENVVTILIT